MFELNKLQSLAFHNSNRLQLTINEADRENVWHQAQHHSNPISRYNAYLNGVCLKTFLNWLSEWFAEEAFPQPSVWHAQDLASIWEVLNGTAFQIGETRLILIPSDETELEEFSVPQEWVDIPNWSADYYLPVQVNLDGDDGECWIELCGFATHRQLKHEGRYNAGDRTYSLAIEELTASLTVMQITFGLNLQQEIAPLPSLSEGEAAKLLQLLSDSSLYSPRLRVGFEQWAAFLANDECKQQLYRNRVETFVPVVETKNPVTLLQRMINYSQAGWKMVEETKEKLGNLEQSLVNRMPAAFSYRDGNSKSHNTIPTLIEILHNKRNLENQVRVIELLGSLEPGNQEAIATLTHLLESDENDILRRQAAVSLGKIDPNNASVGVRIGKTINLGMRLDSDRLRLVLTLTPEGNDKTNVHLLVSPERAPFLPPNLQLTILDEDGKVFLEEEQTDDADNLIKCEFTAAIDDYFQVKIAVNGVSIIEPFTV